MSDCSPTIVTDEPRVPPPSASFEPLTQLFLIDKHWVDHRARQSRKWAKFRPQFTKACNLAQLDGLASSSGWQTIWYPCVQVDLWTIAKDRYLLFYKFEFTQSENRRQKCWIKVVNEPNLGWSAISLTLIDYLRRLCYPLLRRKQIGFLFFAPTRFVLAGWK